MPAQSPGTAGRVPSRPAGAILERPGLPSALLLPTSQLEAPPPRRPGSRGEGLRTGWSAPSPLWQEAAFSGGAAGRLPARSLQSLGHTAQRSNSEKAKESPVAGGQGQPQLQLSLGVYLESQRPDLAAPLCWRMRRGPSANLSSAAQNSTTYTGPLPPTPAPQLPAQLPAGTRDFPLPQKSGGLTRTVVPNARRQRPYSRGRGL